MSKKVTLVIMDGWGKGQMPERSAIAQANTPYIDYLYQNYPNCELTTHSESVGLPDGQMGNSEVGHINIGAGRVVYQELQRINVAIREGVLAQNEALLATFAYCTKHNKPLHLIGLVSDGGVHSHYKHALAICDLAKANGLAKHQVKLHAFTDGRDCDPKSGLGFIQTVEQGLEASVGELASVCGRYYAMDRDNRWERVALAYDMLVKGEGKKVDSLTDAVRAEYAENVTDEFLKPIINRTTFVPIAEGDAVLCFNFRTDRCREITKALTQQNFPEFGMKKLDLHYTTMTVYDHTFKNVHTIFQNDDLTQTLGEILAQNKRTQLRAAETEKYPHVTFFFSGGREKEFEGEKRIMAASPKVATYDLQPEMSALPLTENVLAEIKTSQPDFVCLNYANTDMVGHTGDFSAAMRAAETVDACVRRITDLCLELDYTVLITADHGNADYMINDDGSPNTAHSLNPVPLFLVDRQFKPTLQDGKLGDIAPTVLKLMHIDQPAAMTGVSLF